ncbi:MAG: DUF4230 domain-containing protein [Clostridiales bacterium]|nr:DUF4230 domain-containing protein [Clostridiales bacterium]
MKKIKVFMLISCIAVFGLSGCSQKTEEPDFTGVKSVCELVTLKCYYHNVAKAEEEAKGLLKTFGTGYKKIWIEYSGVVELGIDASKVAIFEPDENNVVQVMIPDAEILDIDLDEDSLSEPLTDSGFLTKVTLEDETEAVAAAQESMRETAEENTELLNQAKNRAKNTIEKYILNVGELIGEEYTVEWLDYEE